ncbi:ABC-2 transporter permease [Caloranaerobacter ferrireducens]|uniref:ABC-2 transporter permease n=1 Tax=Caloranaerobacter ferrireducens TaxID=1323370 RepID=UPI00084E05F7|nr:ABC-2 transporter permease [Caloranaerobacter ferrireducens]
MLNIIIKDIYQSRKLLLLYLLMLVGFIVAVHIFTGDLVGTGIFAMIFPLGLSIKNEIYEQKNKGYSLIKSMPIKYYKIVVSKFIITAIFALFGLIISICTISILTKSIYLDSKIFAFSIGSVTAGMIFVGIFYAIAYKFGAEKANAFIVVFFAFTVVLAQVAFLFHKNVYLSNTILAIERFFKNTNGYILLIYALLTYLLIMLLSIKVFKNSKVV